MLKSTAGITISNFIMIWIVVLNSGGPGWEVSADTMMLIVWLSFFLFASFIFSVATFIASIKQYRTCSIWTKTIYSLFGLLCVAFVVFLFSVDGFNGQFWFEDFPNVLFLTLSCGINILFFIIILFLKLQKKFNRIK